ncbi:PASTA domain-containing protein [Streptomyces lavendulae]|uniref:PASTA domain-containing protein n=1 Tax=Streptomyces lavendulae TaxID=1914 RepID=UPI00340F30BE
MRTHHTAVLLAAAAALSTLSACNPQASTDPKPATPAPAAPRTTSPSGPAPAAKTATLPDLVGKGLQTAQDEAQAAGFHALKSHDALGRDRLQALDRNWKVCTQNPAAGTRPQRAARRLHRRQDRRDLPLTRCAPTRWSRSLRAC